MAAGDEKVKETLLFLDKPRGNEVVTHLNIFKKLNQGWRISQRIKLIGKANRSGYVR